MVLRAWDAAGGAVSISQGVAGVIEDGELNLQDALHLTGGVNLVGPASHVVKNYSLEADWSMLRSGSTAMSGFPVPVKVVPRAAGGTPNVALIGPSGKLGEFDEILKDRFVERKSALTANSQKGATISGRTIEQEIEAFAEKQIFRKTRARIEALSQATGTLAEEGGSRLVPSLNDIKSIRTIEFALDGDHPHLIQAVDQQIARLTALYPDWKFIRNATP